MCFTLHQVTELQRLEGLLDVSSLTHFDQAESGRRGCSGSWPVRFEYLQGQRLHNLSGHTVSTLIVKEFSLFLRGINHAIAFFTDPNIPQYDQLWAIPNSPAQSIFNIEPTYLAPTQRLSSTKCAFLAGQAEAVPLARMWLATCMNSWQPFGC